MKRKRLIVVLILMLLIVSWGCGKSDKREVGEVNLVFWHSFVASSRQALTTLLNEFETANPGIHIQAQYVPTGDALMQKLITAIQSKTAPDIAWIHPDFIDKLANNRSIYALRQFIDGPDGLPASDLADIYLPLIEAATWHDSLYALPMEATTLALICNRDLFKKAGLNPDTPPRTWEELKVYARQLTQDMDQDGKIDRYGFYVPVFPAGGPLNLWMIMQWAPFVWQAGGNLIDPESRMASFDQ
ncbi:MAG: extracellular solute-binding protein, partial [Calditrichales bacterium]